ncbi:MAG: AmmeMemoRadiSam system protein B [Armatimonadota bacterium]|jgi:AmmeMemoRadiSam system protein B
MSQQGEPTARAALAGLWYEGSERALQRELAGCFQHRLGPGELPPEPTEGTDRRTLGLVSPHAGVAYSGPAAAHGYLRIAREGVPEVVVVIGPSHQRPCNATIASGSFQTPLGPATIHGDVAARLLAECDELQEAPRAIEGEQSIELQLPFLKYIYRERLSWVPVMLADQSYELAARLGEAVARVLDGMDAVIVGSSDLSHEHSERTVADHDPLVIEQVLALDAQELIRVRRQHSVTMCGYGAVAVMLAAAKALGATTAEQLGYYTSADIAGAHGYVVGYLSAAITKQA